MYFTGRHERQLDPKGRLALPADYRRRLEPRCYLAMGDGGCVSVFTPEDFEAQVEEVRAKVRTKELPMDHLRAIASSAFEVGVDGQGRINVGEEMRRYASLALGSKVIVVGNIDRVEIWESERFDASADRGKASVAGLL